MFTKGYYVMQPNESFDEVLAKYEVWKARNEQVAQQAQEFANVSYKFFAHKMDAIRAIHAYLKKHGEFQSTLATAKHIVDNAQTYNLKQEV
jgi:hypothetical protein